MSDKAPLKYRALDFYFKRPFLYDIILSVGLCFLIHILLKQEWIHMSSSNVLKEISTDLISVTISLAGFILAALTIIVTFKDSVDSRIQIGNDAKTGKDLFFSSHNYFTSVRIFYRGAIILLGLFLFLTLCKIVTIEQNDEYYLMTSLFVIFLITLTVLRSILLLILIIKIQDKRNIK